jgi:hypothetical protein
VLLLLLLVLLLLLLLLLVLPLLPGMAGGGGLLAAGCARAIRPPWMSDGTQHKHTAAVVTSACYG